MVTLNKLKGSLLIPFYLFSLLFGKYKIKYYLCNIKLNQLKIMKKSLTLSQEIAKNLSYYFGKDKRCTDNKDGCFYSGKTIGKKTQGCFVGRLLPSKDRVKADQYFEEHTMCNSNVNGLVKYKDSIGIEIPKIISDNVKLFGRLQVLHDNYLNWTIEYKLSEIGKNYLKEIIENNNLDKKDFEKFLK